jgi:ATP-dependent Clp protease adapter protein ClpS
MSEQVLSKPITQTRTDLAKSWVVIFHNDNSTTFDCVIEILMFTIGKAQHEAYQLTLKVHEEGQAVVAESTQEIAETLKTESIQRARFHGCPLKVTAERNN